MLKFSTLALTLAISTLICSPSQPAKATGFMELFSKKPIYVNGTFKLVASGCDGPDSKGSYIDENTGKLRNGYCQERYEKDEVAMYQFSGDLKAPKDYSQTFKTITDLYDSSTGEKITELDTEQRTVSYTKNLEDNQKEYKESIEELEKVKAQRESYKKILKERPYDERAYSLRQFVEDCPKKIKYAQEKIKKEENEVAESEKILKEAIKLYETSNSKSLKS